MIILGVDRAVSHKRTHALEISGQSNVLVSECSLDWIIKISIITSMWMAQIYTRPVVEARLMEQESLDICLCRFSRHMKKKNLLKVLCFLSPLLLLMSVKMIQVSTLILRHWLNSHKQKKPEATVTKHCTPEDLTGPPTLNPSLGCTVGGTQVQTHRKDHQCLENPCWNASNSHR